MADLGAQAAEPKKQRPWYRLHLATWVALVLVAGAVLYSNAKPYKFPFPDEYGRWNWRVTSDTYSFGWPVVFLERTQTETIEYYSWSPLRSKVTELDTRFSFDWCPLGVNVLVGLVILSSTGSLLESRARHRRKWHQFTLESLFILAAVLAAFLALFLGQHVLRQTFGGWSQWHLDRAFPDIASYHSVRQFLTHLGAGWTFPIWICVPLLFGIGCTFYLAIWASLCLIGRVSKEIGGMGTGVLQGKRHR